MHKQKINACKEVIYAYMHDAFTLHHDQGPLNQGPLSERTRELMRLKSARYLRTLRLLRLFRPTGEVLRSGVRD